MTLLINEPPLLLSKSLARGIGLNEAIFLQQLHFRIQVSTHLKDDARWIFKTYDEWKEDEFPFWSVETVKRIVQKLEKSGVLVTTSSYNRLKIDRTKWYRIDYEKLEWLTAQTDPAIRFKVPEGTTQNDPCTTVNLPSPITKEVKKDNKEIVEPSLDIAQIIHYLNDKAHKNFKPTSKASARLIKSRFKEGYRLKDFKKVIDVKVEDWLQSPEWAVYLRPSTLFNATNFENYLEKANSQAETAYRLPAYRPLDFSEGEE